MKVHQQNVCILANISNFILFQKMKNHLMNISILKDEDYITQLWVLQGQNLYFQ